MTNNLKSIEEMVEELVKNLIARIKLHYDDGEYLERQDLREVVKKTLTQDRHAIGERILEWVKEVEKESKRHPAIYFKRPDKSDGFNAGYASAMKEVKTFIKSELMNKDV